MSCAAGIYLCVIFYTSSKVLIYAFLSTPDRPSLTLPDYLSPSSGEGLHCVGKRHATKAQVSSVPHLFGDGRVVRGGYTGHVFRYAAANYGSIVWGLNIHSSGHIADFRSGDGACEGFHCVEVSVDSSGLQVSLV